MEQFLRRQGASEKEEIERLRAGIAEIQSRQQHGRGETEEYSSDSEGESEDEDELQLILQDLQRQNEELEIKNNHLNQAIHEERGALIELRVQLRFCSAAARAEPLAEPEPGAEEPPRPPRSRRGRRQAGSGRRRPSESWPGRAGLQRRLVGTPVSQTVGFLEESFPLLT